MDVPYHFGLSALLATIFFPIFGWKTLFIFGGGVLVDVDHYLWYVYRYKDLSPVRCYRKFTYGGAKTNYREFDGILLLFHSIEFVVALSMFSFVSDSALLVLIGYAGHTMLDLVWLHRHAKRLIIDYSVLHWLWTNKIKT